MILYYRLTPHRSLPRHQLPACIPSVSEKYLPISGLSLLSLLCLLYTRPCIIYICMLKFSLICIYSAIQLVSSCPQTAFFHFCLVTPNKTEKSGLGTIETTIQLDYWCLTYILHMYTMVAGSGH